MEKLSYKSLFLIVILLLIPIVFLLRIRQKPYPAAAGWWNDSWNYRQRLDVAGVGTSAVTDFQISVDIGTSALIAAGKMKSDCSDIRLTDQAGNVLPHWIEGGSPGCNQAADTKIWVKVPSLPASGTAVYFYYGNPSASNIENPDSVFLLFDDFKTVDTAKWIDTTGTNAVISDGYDSQALSTTGDANDIRYYSRTTFSGGYAVKARMKEDGTDGGIFFDVQDPDNGYLITSRRPGSTSAFMWFKRVTANWTGLSLHNNISSWTNTEYRTLDIIRVGTSLAVADNGTTVVYATPTDATFSGGGVGIRANDGTGQQTVDWIFVRKAALTAPSVTPAAEETGGGPVAWWKFDEGVGTTAFDSSASRINATFTSTAASPKWVTEDMCISGKCVLLSGTNSEISTSNSAALNFGTQNFTINLWIKPTRDLANNDVIFSKSSGLNHYNYVNALFSAYGELRWYFDDSSETLWNHYVSFGANSIFTNKWSNIVLVREGNAIRAYLNGVLKSGSTLPDNYNLTNTNGVEFGKENAIGTYYQGYLDDIKIYPYARTDAQIKQTYTSDLSGQSSAQGNAANIGSASSKNLTDGLVGYWKFNEGIGTTSADASSNSNLATFGAGNSSPAWDTGKYGVGLSFSGGQYVSTGRTLPGDQSFSISAWAKPQATVNDGAVIAGIAGYHMGIIGKNSKICGQHWDNSNPLYICEADNNQNQWHHFLTTFDGTSKIFTFYKDGLAVGSTYVANPRSNSPFYIGGINSSLNYYFTGFIDEVRTYNRALSAAEAKQLYNLAPGPVGYWKFEEGTGTTAFDTSGNGNNGVFGSGTSAPTWVSGKTGKGLMFDVNRKTYVDVGNDPSLNPSTAFTVEAWIKPSALANNTNYNIFAKELYSGKLGYRLFLGGYSGCTNLNCLQLGIGNSSSLLYYSGGNLTSIDTWYHVAAVFNSGNVKLFVNGSQTSNSNSTVTSIVNTSLNADIGRHSNAGEHFPGIIDEVKYYNYARSPSQILEDMGTGAGTKDPVIWYKLDEGQGTLINNYGVGGSLYHADFGSGDSAPAWDSGRYDRGLSFDGDNDTTQLNSYYYPNYDNFTISAWFNLNSGVGGTSDYFPIFGNSQNTPFLGYWPPSKTWSHYRQFTGGVGSTTISWTTPVQYADSQWHYVAVSVDQGDTAASLYLDGKFFATKSIGGTEGYTASNGALRYIGRDWGTSWQGKLDDLKVYSYALSADEIKTDYNRGSSAQIGQSSQTIGATTTSLNYCVPGDTNYCAAPVGEWNFEEGTGTTAYDVSGNNNNLRWISGSNYYVAGKVGKAANFNADRRLELSDVSKLDFGTGSFTVSTWMKAGAKNVVMLFSKGWHGYAVPGFRGYFNGTALYFYVGDGTNFIETPATNFSKYRNDWAKYDFVFDSSTHTGSIYINGQYQNSGTNNLIGSIGNTLPFTLGARSTDGYDFQGQLDQVRIYNYARTPAQVAWDYNQGGPIGWWKFDECQGDIAYDASGLGNTGAINIGPSGTQNTLGTCQAGTSAAWTAGAAGKRGASLNFDGNDDWVNLGDPSSGILDITGDMTVAYWVKPSLLDGAYHFAVSKNYTGEYEVGNLNSDLVWRHGNGTVNYNPLSWSNFFSEGTGQWYHVVVTRNTTTGKIQAFKNGSAFGSPQSYTYAAAASANPLYIGRRSGAPYYYPGQLDDIQLYNYALTPSQIKTLYNNGAASFGQ